MKYLKNITDWKECINEVVCGDCSEGMKLIPNNSVDLVVTSPPYDNLRDYDGFEWSFEKTAQELKRVLKEGGVIVWIVGDQTVDGSETGTSFKQALHFKEIGMNLHDTMIYHKSCYPPLTHNRYEQAFEFMFVISKGKPKTFSPIMVPTDTAGINRPRLKSNKEIGSAVRNDDRVDIIKDNKIKSNVWLLRPNNTHHNHPAMFPEMLVLDHLQSWSNQNDTVLDPFMGSWTTARAAKDLGRNFIGFELSEKYCSIGEKRLRQQNLF